MIGDLNAAIEFVEEWQSISQLDTLAAATPAPRLKAWQEAADAKDKGNDLFRQGDFTGMWKAFAMPMCIVLQHVAHHACWLHAGALRAYEQSLSAAPECAAVHCNKAAALAKLERHQDAMAAAQHALLLNRNYAKVKHELHLYGAYQIRRSLRIMLVTICCKLADVSLFLQARRRLNDSSAALKRQ